MKEPVKNFKNKLYPSGDVTQYFGENKELYGKAVCVQRGDGTEYCLNGHNGIDIVRPWGSQLFSVETGTVVEVKDQQGGFGKHIRILNNKHEWTYGHLSGIAVKLGQKIKAGELIGLMGSTGFVVSGATPYWKYNPYKGTHLHLGLRNFKPFNPKTDTSWTITYATGDKGQILGWDNGFMGAIDWIPLWDTKTQKLEKCKKENSQLKETIQIIIQWIKSYFQVKR